MVTRAGDDVVRGGTVQLFQSALGYDPDFVRQIAAECTKGDCLMTAVFGYARSELVQGRAHYALRRAFSHDAFAAVGPQ